MRISTTTLESYRLFMQPDQEWMTEEELIATIEGKFIPNHAVLVGQAFGKVLETPDAFRVPGGYAAGGFTFDADVMAPALARIDRRGLFEVKATKAYGAVDVVAKCDHILGAHLREFKTTLGSFDFDKYAHSCQWRFMVDIFEPLRVTYDVFLLNEDNGVITIRGIESFDLYPYPELHDDCEELLRKFCGYVTAKGLDGLLRARQKAAA